MVNDLKKVRVKPSKFSSAIAGIVGIMFVIFGIAQVIPMAGTFGIIWTLGAACIAGYHIYNLFSSNGVGVYEIDIHEHQDSEDFEVKLRKLSKLYQDGIISKEEYENKKSEILNSKW